MEVGEYLRCPRLVCSSVVSLVLLALSLVAVKMVRALTSTYYTVVWWMQTLIVHNPGTAPTPQDDDDSLRLTHAPSFLPCTVLQKSSTGCCIGWRHAERHLGLSATDRRGLFLSSQGSRRRGNAAVRLCPKIEHYDRIRSRRSAG